MKLTEIQAFFSLHVLQYLILVEFMDDVIGHSSLISKFYDTAPAFK